MISCQDVDVLAAALSVGSLNGGDEAALQQHLAGCAGCRRVAGEYMRAAARLPLALEQVAPPPGLRGRLMRAVYAEAGAGAVRHAASQPATWWRRMWDGVPASRGWTAVVAAAAAAVIGFATWTGVSSRTAAPRSVSVALVATSAAPQARGQLTYPSGGSQAVLTATGLPGAAAVAGQPGAIYEVWLIDANGVAVAAAYLGQGPDGTWSAAIHEDMGAYTSLAATVEPLGGSPQPTGIKVIQGSLIRA
ncbi:MAG: anti-sigma factor [Candidatus Dormibacter sp.]